MGQTVGIVEQDQLGGEVVKRFFRVSSMVIAVICFVALEAQAGNGGSGKHFWGLWEGVDSQDGSIEQVSIGPGAGRSFDVLWRESYWTICDGRRGILIGTGALAPKDKDLLEVEMSITCFEPEEVVLEGSITFELVGKNMLLVSDPGVFTNLPFFRVSGRVRGGGNGED